MDSFRRGPLPGGPILRGLMLALCILGSATTASAQGSAGGTAVNSAIVVAFLANPAGLLQSYPDGGPKMISAVRLLVVTSQADPAVLSALTGLSAAANAAQQSALGAGLAQAALIVVHSNPVAAATIQAAVVASGTSGAGMAAEFSAVTGNTATTATAAAAAAAAGGAGDKRKSCAPERSANLCRASHSGGSSGGES